MSNYAGYGAPAINGAQEHFRDLRYLPSAGSVPYVEIREGRYEPRNGVLQLILGPKKVVDSVKVIPAGDLAKPGVEGLI